ncbi:hypothetical protein [Paenibacillus glycanilyticus]|uniref:Sugar ABC transporter permease n=1 Tax=Paenibacillus glycanilyticus TaxID=126569 RepID=A0ABQ6GMU3_9BACL|nr:hypothetical protein [Paenibacillus glycanilyticus]GLX70713.1 hypothetical protein MU1_50590 [Paenibacillus glycanilyticus]
MKKWGFWRGYLLTKKIKKWIRQDTSAALMFLGPSVCGFALFYLIPFAMSVFDSFMDNSVDNVFG